MGGDSLVRAKLRGPAVIQPEVQNVTGPSLVRPKTDPRKRDELMDRVRQRLFALVDPNMLANRNDPNTRKELTRMITEIVNQEGQRVGAENRLRLVSEILMDLIGYGPIQPLLEDPDVTEVMVNRFDRVYYEKNGKIHRAESIAFRDDEHVKLVIQKIVGPIGRRIDEASPLVDARLPDGSRVNAVVNLSLDGACVTIRKFSRPVTAEKLLEYGSLDRATLDFLAACVKGKLNILISGGTGSGKTALLNALSAFVPGDERVITIEDAAELHLQQEHVVRLEARPPNIEGQGGIPIRALLKNALRMRPDRIVVGEVRGPEALDMLQAMNTGHDGSLTTLHANSPKDALSRLETMVLMAGEELPHRAIREQIAAAIDLIVHVSRMRDGSRKVVSVCDVGTAQQDGFIAVDEMITLRMTEGGVAWARTGHEPRFLHKLAWQGVELPGGGGL
ncbi:MAG: CpaF family protein [Bacillota bacterium]